MLHRSHQIRTRAQDLVPTRRSSLLARSKLRFTMVLGMEAFVTIVIESLVTSFLLLRSYELFH